MRPPQRKRPTVGLPSLRVEGTPHEQRVHATKIESHRRTADTMLQGKILQQRGRKCTVHHEIRISRLFASIRLVIVNAMAVESQR